jgi:type IV pilus assembly protein PilE
MKQCANPVQRGFTLVELMIVVAVVAILAAVTYPSYTEYVARGHRTELKADVAAAQQWMERFYSELYRYPSNDEFQAQAFHRSPSGGGSQQYALAITVPTGSQSYTLVAAREAHSGMANDPCGNLSVTSTGVKALVSNTRGSKYGSDAEALAACWP